MQRNQPNAEEIALKPHVYDANTKQYIACEPSHQEYPKWMYKNGKSRLVKTAEEESTLKGWANMPPKPPSEIDDDEVEAAVSETPVEDDLVPASSAPRKTRRVPAA